MGSLIHMKGKANGALKLLLRLYILWLRILVETMEKEDCKQLVKHLKI